MRLHYAILGPALLPLFFSAYDIWRSTEELAELESSAEAVAAGVTFFS
jgi:hypothetical protein